MKTACDNCQSLNHHGTKKQDLTKEAVIICKCINNIARTNVTMLHLSEVLKGSMNAKVVEKNHQNLEIHGLLSKYKKNDIERFMRKLIFEGYISEDPTINSYTDTVVCYIKLGKKKLFL
jgi:bloom syndrome protein